MKTRRQYVCGFCFSPDKKRVVLIKKTKPEWQKGKFNGVGGKIEPNEEFTDAMVREFYEETGLTIEKNQWNCFALLTNDDWDVWFFKTTSFEYLNAKTTTEEIVAILDTTLPIDNTVPNLKWLIPMSQQDEVLFAHVDYANDGS